MTRRESVIVTLTIEQTDAGTWQAMARVPAFDLPQALTGEYATMLGAASALVEALRQCLADAADGRMMIEVPALYDVARDACHAVGMPWTDPRTGETFKPPKRKRGTR